VRGIEFKFEPMDWIEEDEPGYEQAVRDSREDGMSPRRDIEDEARQALRDVALAFGFCCQSRYLLGLDNLGAKILSKLDRDKWIREEVDLVLSPDLYDFACSDCQATILHDVATG
jgi:hypothetical protein